MAKEMVTIVATPAVQALARKAHDIQDACNGLAVATALLETQRHFRESGNGQKYCGSDMGHQNPVSIALINKLNHLACLEQSKDNCFLHIMDLMEGKDVEVEIDFLD